MISSYEGSFSGPAHAHTLILPGENMGKQKSSLIVDRLSRRGAGTGVFISAAKGK
jgi:hypothetical protein